jgi:hypothetical protein
MNRKCRIWGVRATYPHVFIVLAVMVRFRSQRRSRRFKSDHLHEIPPETAFSCPFGWSLRSGVESLHGGSTVCLDLAGAAPLARGDGCAGLHDGSHSRVLDQSVLWCRTRSRPTTDLRAEVCTGCGAMRWLRCELIVVGLAVGSQSAGVSATRRTNPRLSTSAPLCAHRSRSCRMRATRRCASDRRIGSSSRPRRRPASR